MKKEEDKKKLVSPRATAKSNHEGKREDLQEGKTFNHKGHEGPLRDNRET